MHKIKENTGAFGLKDMPDSERPREKMLERGAGALSNSELIAIVIGSGTRDESAVTLASRILSVGGKSLAGLSSVSAQELMKINGVGAAKACGVCAAIELGRRIASAPFAAKPKLSDPGDAAMLCMEEMRRLPKEVFRVLMLNVKNELIHLEDISVGGINASFSHPREVFSGALKRGAYSIILMHNHPSGDPTPSREDISTTEILCDSGRILGIKVLDHILIGDGVYTSFREENLLPGKFA